MTHQSLRYFFLYTQESCKIIQRILICILLIGGLRISNSDTRSNSRRDVMKSDYLFTNNTRRNR